MSVERGAVARPQGLELLNEPWAGDQYREP
eukprot:COSAG01_NODE_43485_length_429_cov_1.000000_1_plen_29_part_10